jgi:hypothetical protein
MTYVKDIIVQVNGGTENVRIPLYSGNTSGLTKSNKVFYGTTNSGAITGSTQAPILINGTEYYTPIYTGSTDTACCSNIVTSSAVNSTDTFVSAGFVLIDVNGTESLFMEIFSNITVKSFSASIANVDVTSANNIAFRLNGSNNSYLPLYSGNTSGLTTSDVIFINNPVSVPLTGSSYYNVVINGTTYYWQIYTGPTTTRYMGLDSTAQTGNFTFYGYVLLNVNGTNLFAKVYNKV